jgi:glycosyltransferase involved in cell wall biosynthesis
MLLTKRRDETVAPCTPPSNAPTHVEVLLATRNGASHLPAFLESLQGQNHCRLSLVARDDGSLDETPDLLERAADRLPVRVHRGPRIGHPGCFFQLLDCADERASLFAFADQDDVWFDYKLARATRWLQDRINSPTPTLYCSRATISDSQLRPIGQTPMPRRGPSFANALVQNIAIGCTIVVNRAGLELARSIDWSQARRHDWWLYLAFTGLGEVRYDPQPGLLYRQHAANVVGAGAGPLTRLQRRLARYLDCEMRAYRTEQVAAFRKAVGARLGASDRALIDSYLDARCDRISRIKFAASGGIRLQSPADELAFRTTYGLGLF